MKIFHDKKIEGMIILLMFFTSPLMVTYSYAEENENEFSESTKSEERINEERLLKSILSENIVNFKQYQVGIVLFDEKSVKSGKNIGKISVNDTINQVEKEELEISNKVIDSNMNSGDLSEKKFAYKVIFSGKISEGESNSTFAMSFSDLDIKLNMEQGIQSIEPSFSEDGLGLIKSFEID